MLSMNSKQSYLKPAYPHAPENTKRWSAWTGLIRLAARALSRLLSDLKKDATDITQAVKDVWAGPELDPKRFAETPPKWWHGTAEPVEIPEQDDYFRPTEGGFAVGFDGALIYSKGETPAERKGWKNVGGTELTEQDYGEMLAYQPRLTNTTLAKQIKPLWKHGKKPREIALIVGCSESYAKHYVICFERAQRASNASPIGK